MEFKTNIDTCIDFEIKSLSGESRVKTPIFIIGCPRSRTTVIGRCLQSHPMISWLERESMFFLHLSDILKNLHRWGLWSLKEKILEEELLAYLKWLSDNVILKVIDSKPSSYFYCDHTPWYTNIIPFLKALYPNAKFIHVLRDPRPVITSLWKSYEQGRLWAGDSIKTRFDLWISMTRNAIKERWNPNYLELNSEDLIIDADTFFSKIYDFLGIEKDDSFKIRLEEDHAANNASRGLIIKPWHDENVTWPEWCSEDEKEIISLWIKEIYWNDFSERNSGLS